jgi:uncharacterized membrane protein
MKKSAIIITFLALLILPMIVYAEENVTQGKGFKETTNAALEKQVTVPDSLQVLARILFGIKSDNPINFQKLVILFAGFLVIFFIIRDILRVMPIFQGSALSNATGIVITSIVGVSGGLLAFSDLMLSLGSMFGLLSEWEVFGLILTLIILLILLFAIDSLTVMIRRESKISEAERKATEAGAAISMWAKLMNKFKK